jgi:RimJ/RimL family protein N-acetyltransferase
MADVTAAEMRVLPWNGTPQLVAFLVGNEWPYHRVRREHPGSVESRIADGFYDGPATRTFLVEASRNVVGMMRLFDLDDPTPMFDLRIAAARRGDGLGRACLRWLTEHVFAGYPHATRVQGTTRQDNVAMRRVFAACGYVQEAHYRRAWPTDHGEIYDAVGYAILREDWASGTTTVIPRGNDVLGG